VETSHQLSVSAVDTDGRLLNEVDVEVQGQQQDPGGLTPDSSSSSSYDSSGHGTRGGDIGDQGLDSIAGDGSDDTLGVAAGGCNFS
jgi:hypothetical protein